MYYCVETFSENRFGFQCKGLRRGEYRVVSLKWIWEGHYLFRVLPQWLSDKESACRAGDPGLASLIPGLGRSPEEEMGNHFSILAWKIPWTEEPGGLQSMRSQRVGRDWVIKHDLSIQEMKKHCIAECECNLTGDSLEIDSLWPFTSLRALFTLRWPPTA